MFHFENNFATASAFYGGPREVASHTLETTALEAYLAEYSFLTVILKLNAFYKINIKPLNQIAVIEFFTKKGCSTVEIHGMRQINT